MPDRCPDCEESRARERRRTARRMRALLEERRRLTAALDMLVDHHCGGLCGCGAHDDPPHDEVMRICNEARARKETCSTCGGSGVRAYGSTATWRGGIGGQMVTSDVCNKCWGSGDAAKPWPSRWLLREQKGTT